MVEIIANANADEWHKFLQTQCDATLYHTPEWKAFLEKTFGYEPRYLYATDESGRLIGMLPLFEVKSRLTGNRLCSVPFSHECGCLGDSVTRNALIDGAVAFRDKSHIEKIEIRSTVENPCFQEKNTFCTHILELSQNLQETWKRLDKSSVRWAIRKSEKLGVSVESSTTIEDLKEFYELNCLTKQILGVPCHPWKFFKNLFSILNGNVRMYISRHKGNTIAGGVIEHYRDRVLYGYGAADPSQLYLHPYNAFIWKSIEDACINGCRAYDFGRTSCDNTGLIQFKKKWGTQERELCYSYYPSSGRSVVTERDSTICRLGNSVIRTMPMSAYKAFSMSVFGHFG
ncbi:lipid II:glycine glycyltransferase FemX [Methanothrix soehngenii]